MSIALILAAFGGGLFAAAIGGVPSFIFTGLTVVAAILAGDFGASAIGIVSFGPWFVPCVAFGGAVAAAAFAKKKNLLEDGADIITPLASLQDASVLLVGGLFGVIGFILNYLVGEVFGNAVFGSAGWTDTVAFCVMTSGIIVRLVFTKSGLLGKTPDGVQRSYVAKGKEMAFLVVLGLGFGILMGGIVSAFGQVGFDAGGSVDNAEAAYIFTQMGSFAFGIGAIGLVFACMGLPFFGCHHIVLPAASTAIVMYSATLNPIAAIVGGAITGLLGAILGDIAGKTLNSYADSHIDPPAVAIFILQLINFTILPMIFPAVIG